MSSSSASDDAKVLYLRAAPFDKNRVLISHKLIDTGESAFTFEITNVEGETRFMFMSYDTQSLSYRLVPTSNVASFNGSYFSKIYKASAGFSKSAIFSSKFHRITYVKGSKSGEKDTISLSEVSSKKTLNNFSVPCSL